MIEVHPGLFVGNNEDFVQIAGQIGPGINLKGEEHGWAVIHACKEPYHREFVGYTSKAAPRGPEYLFSRHGWRLALNLVDVAYPEYIRPELVNQAMAMIGLARATRLKVLIHCNQGGSRAPSLALHWLHRFDERFKIGSFELVEVTMRYVYPPYHPAEGIRGYVREHWDDPSVFAPVAGQKVEV